MKVAEALIFVNSEIAKLEAANKGKELRPWVRGACPAALEHWGRIQQRIALGKSKPHAEPCCASLNLEKSTRALSEKQESALIAARAARMSKSSSQDECRAA